MSQSRPGRAGDWSSQVLYTPKANDEAGGRELGADHGLLRGARSRRGEPAFRGGERFGDHRWNAGGHARRRLSNDDTNGMLRSVGRREIQRMIRPALAFTDTAAANPSPAAKAAAPAMVVKSRAPADHDPPGWPATG